MPAGVAELQLLIRAKDQAKKVLAENRSSIQKTADVAKKAGVVAGVAAAGAGAAAIKMAVDFENSMAEVKTLLPDLDKEGFAKLTASTLRFSREMGIATNDSVPALYQAISAGVPQENVFTFMEIAAKASVGGITELETAVDGITSVVNAYGVEVVDAQKASDVMFTAVKLGKTDFNQLSASMFNVIPTAASLGVKVEDVAAGLARMTAQGTPTSVATTQLRSVFVEASKSGTLLSDMIKSQLGASFEELIAKGQSSGEILNALRENVESNGLKFADMFGSVEALNAALAITGDNAAGFESALAQMEGAAGATDAAFNTMSNTTSFKVNKAINAAKVRMTEFGGTLMTQLPMLGAAGAALGGLAPVITMLTPALGLLSVAWSGMGVAARIAWAAALGPVGLIIAGITAAVAVGVLIWKNWDTIKAKAIEVFGFILDLFNSKWAWLLPGGPLIKAILFFKDNWRDMWNFAVDKVTLAWEAIKGVINGGLQVVLGGINAIIEAWNNLSFEIPSFSVAGKKFGGQSFSLPNLPTIPIPSFDKGGVVPGPLGSLQIVQARGGERFLGANNQLAGNSLSVTVVVQGDVHGVDDLDRLIQKSVRDAAMRGGFREVFARA